MSAKTAPVTNPRNNIPAVFKKRVAEVIEMPLPKMQESTSSMLTRVGFCTDTNLLCATFRKSGNTFGYKVSPEVANRVLNAEANGQSAGKLMLAEVIDKVETVEIIAK